MIKAVATAVETAERSAGQTAVQPLYLEALTLVERLHRRLLDVIKDEFDRRGRADINSVQALLLYNIGDKELTAGELRTRPCVANFHSTDPVDLRSAYTCPSPLPNTTRPDASAGDEIQ